MDNLICAFLSEKDNPGCFVGMLSGSISQDNNKLTGEQSAEKRAAILESRLGYSFIDCSVLYLSVHPNSSLECEKL